MVKPDEFITGCVGWSIKHEGQVELQCTPKWVQVVYFIKGLAYPCVEIRTFSKNIDLSFDLSLC